MTKVESLTPAIEGSESAGRGGATDPSWWLYIAVGLVVMGVYFAVPANGSTSVLILKVSLYCLISCSAVVAVALGVLRHRPRQRLPWALLLANQLVYLAGDVTFYVRHDLLNLQAFPSISDVFYLLHYPLLVAALWLFVRARTPGRDRPALLDGVILTTGAALIGWVFIFGPQVHGGSGSFLVRATSLAYPVMDLGVLAVGLRLLIGAGIRGRSFFLLAGSLTLLLAADVTYGLQQLAGIYSAGNFVDAMWFGYYLLLGAAALHPSMSTMTEPSPPRDVTVGWRRLSILGLAAAHGSAGNGLAMGAHEDTGRRPPRVRSRGHVLVGDSSTGRFDEGPASDGGISRSSGESGQVRGDDRKQLGSRRCHH